MQSLVCHVEKEIRWKLKDAVFLDSEDQTKWKEIQSLYWTPFCDKNGLKNIGNRIFTATTKQYYNSSNFFFHTLISQRRYEDLQNDIAKCIFYVSFASHVPLYISFPRSACVYVYARGGMQLPACPRDSGEVGAAFTRGATLSIYGDSKRQ